AVAVLGPCHTETTSNIPGSPPHLPVLGVPPHKMISRQKLRPGSGCLSVKVVMDGPIRVLEIADRQSTEIVHCELKDMSDWEVYDVSERVQGSTEEIIGPKQLEVTMSLKGGLGISVINHLPEELLYIKLSNISLEVVKSSALLTVETSVASVQVDNQMIGASRPVVLFVTQTNQRETVDNTPALFITAHKLPSGKWNAEIYKHVIVTTKRLTILLEERLILKLLLLLGYETNGSDMVQLDDNNHQVLPTSSTIQATRYYFSSLKIKTGRVTLSMATSSNLSPDLQLVKHSLAVPLIAFEDAKVDLGAGKGIVGTVTKPVTGVLDFTSGVANAVRDKSQVSSKQHPPRSRDPRVSPGIHGVISTYSPSLARAQLHLYNLNNNNHNE
ncbi:hypothetical protein LOTGIDRAFT_175825, partial [Lottia gigantea]